MYTDFINSLNIPKSIMSEVVKRNKIAKFVSGIKVDEDYLMQLNNKTTAAINKLLVIVDLFKKNNIPYLLIKGPALSKILYKDACIRVIGDLDFIVKKEFIIDACILLESIGFKDFQIDAMEQALNHEIDIQTKRLYYSRFFYEKSFYHPDDAYVEIKECPYCIENKSIIKHFFDNAQFIEINGVKITTLSLEDTLLYHFINAITNINTSRCGNYDFKLRDLFDTDRAIDILIQSNLIENVFNIAEKYNFEKHIGTAILASYMLLNKSLPKKLNDLCLKYKYDDFLEIWDAKTYLQHIININKSEECFNESVKQKTINAPFISPLNVFEMEDFYDLKTGVVPTMLSLVPAFLGCEALSNQFKISFLRDEKNIYFVTKSTDELNQFGLEVGILNLSLDQDSKLNNVIKFVYSDKTAKIIVDDFQKSKIFSSSVEDENIIVSTIPIESLYINNSIQSRDKEKYIFFYILVTSPEYIYKESLDTKFYYMGLRDCHHPLVIAKS